VIRPRALLKDEEKAKERKLISPVDLAGYEAKTRAFLNIYSRIG
jgi:hypothetical protein